MKGINYYRQLEKENYTIQWVWMKNSQSFMHKKGNENGREQFNEIAFAAYSQKNGHKMVWQILWQAAIAFTRISSTAFK